MEAAAKAAAVSPKNEKNYNKKSKPKMQLKVSRSPACQIGARVVTGNAVCRPATLERVKKLQIFKCCIRRPATLAGILKLKMFMRSKNLFMVISSGLPQKPWSTPPFPI